MFAYLKMLSICCEYMRKRIYCKLYPKIQVSCPYHDVEVDRKIFYGIDAKRKLEAAQPITLQTCKFLLHKYSENLQLSLTHSRAEFT